MLRFSFFKYKVVRRLLGTKFAFNSETVVPELSFGKLSISYKNLVGKADPVLLEGLSVLEQLTGNRPGIASFTAVRDGTKFTYKARIVVTLRGTYLYNFLSVLQTIYSYKLYSREGSVMLENKGLGMVVVAFNNIEVFNLNTFLKYKLPRLSLQLAYTHPIPFVVINRFLQIFGIYI